MTTAATAVDHKASSSWLLAVVLAGLVLLVALTLLAITTAHDGAPRSPAVRPAAVSGAVPATVSPSAASSDQGGAGS